MDDDGRSRIGIIALGLVVCAAAAAASYWWLHAPVTSTEAPRTPTATTPAAAAAASPVPTEAAAPDKAAPPPADGDALLRRLAAGWSNAPELASWLAAESIVQRLAAATNMVAAGANPRAMLGFVELGGDFTVDEKLEKGERNAANGVDVREQDFISDTSYARYDRLTGIITGIDPTAAGRGYAQLRPYLDGAFAQIARPGERFDAVVSAAVDRMVATPIPEGPIEVVPAGAIYKFADPKLEALRPAEKQLIRFGATNQKALRLWLQRFGAAAGVSR